LTSKSRSPGSGCGKFSSTSESGASIGSGCVNAIARMVSFSIRPAAYLLHARQSFVCPNRRVLKLPRLLTGWWCSLPLKLPGESGRKRSCNDAQGLLGELGILLGGFRESKAVQLRVDLDRLHGTIIASRVEAPSLPDPVRDVTSWPDDGSRLLDPLPQRRFVYRLVAQITVADYQD
jgi:hypothetical protein